MKNSAELRGRYPPRPSASVDKTLIDLQNSSYPTQPYSVIAKYCLTCRVIIKATVLSFILFNVSPQKKTKKKYIAGQSFGKIVLQYYNILI